MLLSMTLGLKGYYIRSATNPVRAFHRPRRSERAFPSRFSVYRPIYESINADKATASKHRERLDGTAMRFNAAKQPRQRALDLCKPASSVAHAVRRQRDPPRRSA